VGEVTHLMVSPEAQGKGVGRLLVEEAERIARGSGLDELVLVTPPDLPARQFYEHLGWQDCGEVRSRSGEVFVRYRVTLGP
jgi:GNAT superfamily N-acetyltransferase